MSVGLTSVAEKSDAGGHPIKVQVEETYERSKAKGYQGLNS